MHNAIVDSHMQSHNYGNSVKYKEKQMKWFGLRLKDYFLSCICEALKNSSRGQVEGLIYFH